MVRPTAAVITGREARELVSDMHSNGRQAGWLEVTNSFIKMYEVLGRAMAILSGSVKNIFGCDAERPRFGGTL